MNQYWFKPKNYGYGFTPITREGWIATIVLLSLVLGAAYINGFFSGEVDLSSGMHFLFETLCFVIAFTLLFKDRVKGGLRWKWGADDEDEK